MDTTDSLRSLISSLGDPERDKAVSLAYYPRILDDAQLGYAYRSSWIAKKAINIPALDAVRKWRNWQADATDITKIEEEEKRLGLKQKLLWCKTLARLWGGAAIFIGDGDDASQPFEPEKVGKGGIKYLTVLSRRELAVPELDRDPLSEFFGQPKMYQVTGSTQFNDVHPSRLVIQIGDAHPDPWNAVGTALGWGDSSLQSMYQAMLNSDSTAANIASLVFEANIDVFKIPDLMEKVATQAYRSKLVDRFTLAAIGKSVSKSLMLDGEEEYERKTVTFASLPELIQQFILLVCGAADIPLTRFLGDAPSGLGSNGEHSMNNYHDRVSSMQELEIQPALYRLDEALIRSALGARPSELFYTWAPLKLMSEKEKAEIGKAHTEAAKNLVDTGLFMPEELRASVGNQLVESGYYPGLADLLKQNGDTIPEFDLGARQQEAATAAAENAAKAQPKPVVKDATPRTLYMRRDVLNGQEIANWFKAQGVPDVYAPESMHVTVVYSKQPVDWMKLGEPWDAKLEVQPGGPRLMELFGPNQDVLVLLFKSRELDWRHEAAKEAGASYDFDEYQSHISISLSAGGIDLANIKPFQGHILLGPEVYEEIDTSTDWREKVATE